VRASAVPTGGGWLHEVKFDGYRYPGPQARQRLPFAAEDQSSTQGK
jgi:hypothetical protein